MVSVPFSELSRFGRSLGQIVTILDALAKAEVAFVALKENIQRCPAGRRPPPTSAALLSCSNGPPIRHR